MDLKENQIASAITSFPHIQPYNLFPATYLAQNSCRLFISGGTATHPAPTYLFLQTMLVAILQCHKQVLPVITPGTNPSRTTYSGDSRNSQCAGHLTTLKTDSHAQGIILKH